MLRIIIIDDEPMGINILNVLLDRTDIDLQIIGTTTNPEKGIELINTLHPNLVFLDINMPKIDGFELLDRLNYKNFKLVFTTAHREYAIKAIKNKAFDYLLKPIDYTDLLACVENCLNEITDAVPFSKNKTMLELSVGDGIIFIKQSSIYRIEADGSYAIIYYNDGKKHIASRNLKYLEALLDNTLFFRCHQSHIINLKEVVKLITSDGTFVKLSNDELIEVGKMQKDGLLERLKMI